MLETFRYWILSFLKDEVVIETCCFTDEESFLHKKRPFDMTTALVFSEKEIREAQSFCNKLATQGVSLGTTMLVLSSSLQKYRAVVTLHAFTQQVPLANCMQPILHTLQTSSSLYVQEAGANFRPFTKREKQVLEFLAQGIGIKEIAHTLGISKYTVITYQRNLYLKTGARTLQQLALFAALHVCASS